ncbi:MAG: HEAT repeat domain-containing protein [Cyanobacteria bacterium SZAS-4]|nr:HEAT repeat domain-containing protein [Cyanobacteria bacterium SZAS-4]
MFNLLTKFFGFHGKEESTSSADTISSVENLRSKRATDSSTSHDAIRPRESSKLGETTIPITTSQTNMKARSYWSQGHYNGHSAQTQQQQLNMLYAPPVGPISQTQGDTVWNSYEGSAKHRALSSYLTKASQEIQSPQAGDTQLKKAPQFAESNFAPKKLSDTQEIIVPRSTQEILHEMANHEDAEVRAHIAANELTPTEALCALSGDQSPEVRLKLVSNVNCPTSILELLVNDPHSEVARRATEALRKVWMKKKRSSAA